MNVIVLTEDQARILSQSNEVIELRDGQGNVLARVIPPSLEEEIAAARRSLASGKPRWPSDKVEALLARLTEIREREGMDEAKLRELLQRFRAGEPV